MRKYLSVIILLLIIQSAHPQAPSNSSIKILFIPLDDRPPCLQFTQRIGLIGDADLVTPPKELLGRFTTPGNSDQIIQWLKQQDLNDFKAAIISLDMLVYGGLVASRAFNVETGKALERAGIIEEIHKKAPALPLYVQSVIMRIAPTADGNNDAYRADLARWAEISVKQDDVSKKETANLVSKIPADALLDYKTARKRNLEVNLKAVKYTRSGMIDFLVLSQDDAKPVGVHVADRVQLVEEIERSGLAAKVAVQPGADEVSMLLLARALNHYYKMSPTVKAFYSSEIAANTVMPFEDKPLKETVGFHIRATGSEEVRDERNADLLFYVFASRREPGRATSFAAEIDEKIKNGRRVMVADIDPVGNVQGGDSAFTQELEARGILPELNSYASWNTAANTIGTTLPQGIVFNIAERKLLKNKALTQRIWDAQNWFTFHRVLDDYYFHGLQRSKINIHFGQDKLSSRILDDKTNKEVEEYATNVLSGSLKELIKVYSRRRSNSRQQGIPWRKPANLGFSLPWNRTFEAEINFH